METGGESLPEWILLRVSFFFGGWKPFLVAPKPLPAMPSSMFLKDTFGV